MHARPGCEDLAFIAKADVTLSAASLRAVLECHTPGGATGYVVAVSGGLDSAVLATALAELRPRPPHGLAFRAVHVDHGLQAAAADLQAACAGLCGRLRIAFEVLHVAVSIDGGESIEEAARAARYAALAAELRPGECLLTAHHATDQAETIMLQLLRGAGLKGMSAMPVCRAFGAGWHVRPLLGVAGRDLHRYAAAAGVVAIEDPMNQDLRFDRAYLRRQIWPLLLKRWPGAEVALARASRHMAEAQDILEWSAETDLKTLRDADALSVPGLRALDVARQTNALRHWILSSAVQAPPAARLAEALRQCTEADADHLPAVCWGNHALRRYRDRLFLTAARPVRLGDTYAWSRDVEAASQLADGAGTLRWTVQRGGLDAARLPAEMTVRRRRGGEVLKPHPRARTQSLQHLCQSFGVLPWMRDALPLVFAGDVLVAVADLWLDARWCVAADAAGLGIVWNGAPIVV